MVRKIQVIHMDIKRIGENQIRCALTEEEIIELGFSIDDIIGNTETTQKFMRVVLNLVEEKEQINIDSLSPMVRAELLQDHSMAITFGGESDVNFKNLVDTVNHLMSQMVPEKLEEFHQMSKEEKKNTIDEFLKNLSDTRKKEESAAKKEAEKKKEAVESLAMPADETNPDDEVFISSVPFVLEFVQMDDAIRMSKLFLGEERMPKSTLYKLEGKYYLIIDFIHFSKNELRPLAFAAVEYDSKHFADPTQVAYIQEHGSCIVKNEALQTLMQL